MSSMPKSELDAQHLRVPFRDFRQPVVGQRVKPPVLFRPAARHHHRHLGQPQLGGGHQPAVARDDHAILCHQHRDGEAEPLHRRRNLIDLFRRVLAGVFCVRCKIGHLPHLDLRRGPGLRVDFGLCCHRDPAGHGPAPRRNETNRRGSFRFAKGRKPMFYWGLARFEGPQTARNEVDLGGCHFANSGPKPLISLGATPSETKRNGFLKE